VSVSVGSRGQEGEHIVNEGSSSVKVVLRH